MQVKNEIRARIFGIDWLGEQSVKARLEPQTHNPFVVMGLRLWEVEFRPEGLRIVSRDNCDRKGLSFHFAPYQGRRIVAGWPTHPPRRMDGVTMINTSPRLRSSRTHPACGGMGHPAGQSTQEWSLAFLRYLRFLLFKQFDLWVFSQKIAKEAKKTRAGKGTLLVSSSLPFPGLPELLCIPMPCRAVFLGGRGLP